MSIFKKTPFPTNVFIFASLAALIALPIVFMFFSLLVIDDTKTDLINLYQNSSPKLDSTDPFITKVPSLKDIIKQPVISENDPSFGPKDAAVAIVEYSDYQCKFCQKQEAVLKQIAEKYPNEVRIIWKDYPADSVYSSSWLPGIAARCAYEQSKFWEYHAQLFTADKNSTKDDFLNLAGRFGLAKNRFSDCYDSADIKRQIKNNILEADALDITGVPFIYVNNQEIMGEIGYEDLEKIVADELNK